MFVLLITSTSVGNLESSLRDYFYNSYINDTPYQSISEKKINIKVLDAYKIQKEWATKAKEVFPQIGYKTHLTQPSEQKKYNINTPIHCTLIPKYHYNNFSLIQLPGNKKYILTPKIAITFKKTITKPITSSYIIKNMIKTCQFYIELSYPPYKSSTITYNDIILANGEQYALIKGSKFSKNIILDDTPVPIEIVHNKKTVSSDPITFSSDIFLGNLLWLVNTTIEMGSTISKDDILLIQPLSSPIKVKKGDYTINFGKESSILFKVI